MTTRNSRSAGGRNVLREKSICHQRRGHILARQALAGASVFVLAQFLSAGTVLAAGPCSFDGVSVPGAYIVTCNTPVTNTGDFNSAIEIYDSGSGGGNGASGADGSFNFGSTPETPGQAGGDGGIAPDYQVNNSGALSTDGESAYGLAVSLYGGNGGNGGRGGTAVFFGGAAGGPGGAGGAAGSVTLINSGQIDTLGDDAFGISVRAGGGSGGSGGSGGLGGGISGAGGAGGNGGAGGAIDITNSAAITTSGLDAVGIFAESEGGQAGNGGSSAGAGGHHGGDGGAISVTNDAAGSILTSGDSAHGIEAVSRGGYGGNGGSNFGPGNGGTPGNGGSGGDVTVTNAGSITTTESSAHGIRARSFHGGGGSQQMFLGLPVYGANGISGVVSIYNSGSISAAGDDAHGIDAYSAHGDVIVDVQGGGSVVGGSGDGKGINAISFSKNVTLNNYGTIGAVSGGAIFISGDVVEIQNYGTITGNIRSHGSTYTTFNNHLTGLFESGDNVDIGSPSGFANYGTLSPGGVGTVQTTDWRGGFQQAATGVFRVDADWVNNTSDRIDINGLADLAGSVEVNPISFPSSSNPANTGMTRTWTILTAGGGITDNGITVTDTAAVDYSLLFPDANTLDLRALVNFLGTGGGGGGGSGGGGGAGGGGSGGGGGDSSEPEDEDLGTGGLNGNQVSIGQNLNKIFGGGTTLDFMAGLMTLPTQKQLADGLGQLAPSGDGGSFSSAMSTGQTFGGQLLSCRVQGEAGDANAIIREGQCVWARANARKLDNNGGSEGTAFEETATFISGGAQIDLGGAWRLGAGIGYEMTDLETDSNATSEGERLHLGAVVKYNDGPLLLAGALTGGQGSADNIRRVAFGNFAATATSETDMSFLTGRFTAAYLATFGDIYLRPQVDLAATRLERDAYRERGTGGIALSVRASEDTVVAVSPTLEIGTELVLEGGAIARPFVRGGLTWMSEDTFSTTASFAGARSAAGSFAVSSKVDDVVAEFAAGLDLIGSDDMALRVLYEGQYGDMTTQHTGSIKLAIPF